MQGRAWEHWIGVRCDLKHSIQQVQSKYTHLLSSFCAQQPNQAATLRAGEGRRGLEGGERKPAGQAHMCCKQVQFTMQSKCTCRGLFKAEAAVGMLNIHSGPQRQVRSAGRSPLALQDTTEPGCSVRSYLPSAWHERLLAVANKCDAAEPSGQKG